MIRFLMALALTTAPALAETCNFTTECFEDESCAETSFDMEINQGTLQTVSETIPVTQGGSDAVRVYVGVTASAFHVLTSDATGPARYTTHLFSGPMVISYIGECSQ